MQYRHVPKNGDRLSALGFGAMRLPTRRGRIDEERATRQIRDAIDRGVSYIDTAVPYHGGENERFLGRALQDGYRDRVKLATKLPPWSVKTREEMDRVLEIQLKKLRTDRIDYYLLHSLNAGQWTKLCDLGVLDFLDSALASGRIRNAGFSFHGDAGTFKEIIDAYDWTFCQIQYNFLDETHQAGTGGLRYAASKGIAVMVMEPLRGGMLAANLPAEVEESYRRTGIDRSGAAWALRWVWNHPEVTVVLSGMNDERHIAENLATCEDALPGAMSADELAAVEAAAAAYRRLMKVGCTGCSYCMPCPAGVNIPQCFSLYNTHAMAPRLADRIMARGMYGMNLMGGMSDERADASLCRDCGRCAKACPQGIAIPDELKKVGRTLGGLQTRMIIPLARRMFSAEVKE
jgi:predicted aldo/keto reductase-like oxidoreductase